jgi:hypothetical protein
LVTASLPAASNFNRQDAKGAKSAKRIFVWGREISAAIRPNTSSALRHLVRSRDPSDDENRVKRRGELQVFRTKKSWRLLALLAV